MTEWRKQIDEAMRTWTKVQREMWEGWTRTVSDVGMTRPSEAWEKAVSTWREVVRQSLDAQVEWAKIWAESIRSAAGVPKEMRDWSEQMVKTMESWSETQARLWESWLEAVRYAPPDAVMRGLDENAQQAFQSWKQATEKAIEAQREFISSWASGPERK